MRETERKKMKKGFYGCLLIAGILLGLFFIVLDINPSQNELQLIKYCATSLDERV